LVSECVDIVPEYNRLEDLASILDREQDRAEALGDAFNIYGRLRHAPVEADGEEWRRDGDLADCTTTGDTPCATTTVAAGSLPGSAGCRPDHAPITTRTPRFTTVPLTG
jgi:hypothetical protein